MHEMHKEFDRSDAPRGSYVYLDGSYQQKLWMAKADLQEHRERHTRPLAQIQLFTTTAYAELFQGRDKSVKLMEFLKDIFQGWTKRNIIDVSKS